MRKSLITAIGLIGFLNLNSQTIDTFDCSIFKVGTFHITDDFSGLTVIKWNDYYQFETNKNLGIKVKLSIKWINECSYELIFIKGKKKGDKNYKFEKVPLIVKIISIKGNSYTQVSKFEGNDEEYKNVIKKIK